MLKYTEDHEWLACDGDVATVGITKHAASLLGDLVFVQLPEVGASLAKGEPAGVVESVKAASDVFAPLNGAVVAINDRVVLDPSIVNSDPLEAGWLFKLKLADPKALDELMDEAAYARLIAGSDHS